MLMTDSLELIHWKRILTFTAGGFLLRKWKASDPEALRHLSPDLLDSQLTQTIHDLVGFVKHLVLSGAPLWTVFG